MSGKYQPELGNGVCQECPIDIHGNKQYSPPGSASSSMCVLTCQHDKLGPNGGPCVLCAYGKYKTTVGPGECDSTCPSVCAIVAIVLVRKFYKPQDTTLQQSTVDVTNYKQHRGHGDVDWGYY